jgi:hypothetical protein
LALVALETKHRAQSGDLRAAEERLTTNARRLQGGALPLTDPQRSLALLDQRETALREELNKLRRDSPFDQGRPMVFDGVLRRVTKVRVTDEELVARFGMTHYYQLDVFVNPGRSIKLDAAPDAKSVDTWPVFFWTPEVPEGWDAWVDKDVRQPVRVPGVFFKLFEYESAFSAEHSQGGKQWAPILIGAGVVWEPPDEETSPISGMIAGGLFAAAVLLGWFGVWRYSRMDRKLRKKTVERQREPEAGKSLNEILRDVDVKE